MSISRTLGEEVTNATSAFLEPLTVEQYHAMIREGILMEGAPVELIDGLLVRKDRRDEGGDITTVGPRHAFVVKTIFRLLNDLLQEHDCHVQSQQPVTLSGVQEPGPDIAVVLGHEDDYRDHHPGPGAVPLVIEVADSSLAFDRGEKLKTYAAAGIPAYWIVNIDEGIVEVIRCLAQKRLPTRIGRTIVSARRSPSTFPVANSSCLSRRSSPDSAC